MAEDPAGGANVYYARVKHYITSPDRFLENYDAIKEDLRNLELTSRNAELKNLTRVAIIGHDVLDHNQPESFDEAKIEGFLGALEVGLGEDISEPNVEGVLDEIWKVDLDWLPPVE